MQSAPARPGQPQRGGPKKNASQQGKKQEKQSMFSCCSKRPQPKRPPPAKKGNARTDPRNQRKGTNSPGGPGSLARKPDKSGSKTSKSSKSGQKSRGKSKSRKSSRSRSKSKSREHTKSARRKKSRTKSSKSGRKSKSKSKSGSRENKSGSDKEKQLNPNDPTGRHGQLAPPLAGPTGSEPKILPGEKSSLPLAQQNDSPKQEKKSKSKELIDLAPAPKKLSKEEIRLKTAELIASAEKIEAVMADEKEALPKNSARRKKLKKPLQDNNQQQQQQQQNQPLVANIAPDSWMSDAGKPEQRLVVRRFTADGCVKLMWNYQEAWPIPPPPPPPIQKTAKVASITSVGTNTEKSHGECCQCCMCKNGTWPCQFRNKNSTASDFSRTVALIK